MANASRTPGQPPPKVPRTPETPPGLEPPSLGGLAWAIPKAEPSRARAGNYELVTLLGRGGMGAVYLAEHREIGRRAAVKVLRPELSKDPLSLARFLREARVVNRLRHPGIVDVQD